MDCLLHGEHHVFDTDCWDHFVARYRSLSCRFPNESHTQLIDRYMLDYESRVLGDFIGQVF